MTSNALKEVWTYRELLYFFAWRDIKLRYRQTLIGAGWAVVQPLSTMLLFSGVFGAVVKIPTNGIPYPVFYLSALLLWTYFANALTLSSNSLISNAGLITKIYFPRVILPASSTLVSLIDMALGAAFLMAVMSFYGFFPTWKLILWPLLLIPLILFTLGMGLWLSALNVKYRDVKFAIPFILQLWLFATPIIYPSSMFPVKFRFLLFMNPLAGIIEGFRATCSQGSVDWLPVGISTSVILPMLLFSWLYFKRTEAEFSDII